MDFITGLPKRKNKNDSIFVVVEKLSKMTHSIRVKSTYKTIHSSEVKIQGNTHFQYLLEGDIYIAWDTQGNHLRLRH